MGIEEEAAGKMHEKRQNVKILRFRLHSLAVVNIHPIERPAFTSHHTNSGHHVLVIRLNIIILP